MKRKTKKKILIDSHRRLQEISQELFVAKKELEEKNKELEEARKREEYRKRQLEQELEALKRLKTGEVKRRTFSKGRSIKLYSEVMKKYMMQKNSISAQIAEKTAHDFFKKGISGKETMEIHLATVESLTKKAGQGVARKIVEQSRFLLLGVMANLVDFYMDYPAQVNRQGHKKTDRAL